MGELHTAFSSTVIVGRYTLVLTERTIIEDERVFDLQIDGLPHGELRLLKYYQPGLAIGNSQAAIWGGNDLYLTPIAETKLHHYEQDDTALAAYPLEDKRRIVSSGKWCLVRETSVTILDPSIGRETARYDHGEIILRYSWSGDRLMLEDLQERHIALPLAAGGEQWKPEPEG